MQLDTHVVRSTWQPWSDVEITTWLIPAASWHVRVHRLRTSRSLLAAEGGFALPLDDERWTWDEPLDEPGVAAAVTGGGTSVIWSLRGAQERELVRADTHTNLIRPRTIVPTLISRHDPGEHWIACGVTATRGRVSPEDIRNACPSLTFEEDAFTVNCSGRLSTVLL